ncbi:nucleoside diphosphate-linked moiety X motif 17 isoform X2 [Crotalus tigris]|uniref:nucleoside diphosphate-linked moiety X motif 17 isoform X2 n=1 Tax=Crotalus tigris TaxID=88082 RepID=UPI00192F1690|nr:nucleoside diphosphate-linked moiety X motif 17 isoform X2 [Crotalus tigris]
MLAGRRVAVHVCRGGGFPQRARFEQSIVGHCCPPHEDSGIVHCALKPLQFLVSDQEFPGSTRLLLKRPPFCPIKHLTVEQRASLPTESRCQGVDVGVAVLLESANQKILLTRRARTLSLFPTAWVPPGGHIELEEELLDAGLRELEEETGLQLQDGEFSWHLLALWESVYPPQLSQGLPQRHHIVIYLHLALHESHQQLQARLKPNEAEVSAVAWLDRPTLASIVATEDGAEGEIPGAGRGAPPTVSIVELEKGSTKTLVIPTATFLATAQGEDVEQVSTGTKYALRQWLNLSPP